MLGRTNTGGGSGGGGGLNFNIIGGTSAPKNPNENDIWVNTATAISEWHFSVNEPNVYTVTKGGSDWDMKVSHKLNDGDILNFTTLESVPSTYGSLEVTDSSGKMFFIRDYNGGVLPSWAGGTKVGLIISGQYARLVTQGKYYHVEGSVWVFTGKYSTAEFNALKKNGVTVYPVYAYQYVDGAWEKKDAVSWQNGEWKEWAWFLYPSELEYVKYAGANVKVTVDGDVVNFVPSQSSNSNWTFGFKVPIDVTDKHFFRATINLTKGVQSGYSGIAICSKLPTTYNLTNIVASHYADSLGVTELEIPLSSLTGTYYICARSTYATGSITNFRLV